ncbi:hypothetical protein BBJ28_00003800 [Nothophytophthora sp. Chile5]|nr:hypothetical protein BBJ28_00003800 [Nothophytophthora sp. Chile5]
MHKAMLSGCETLATLVDGKLKRNLVALLFLLSELRGRVKWSPTAYANTLGITVKALDDLVQTAEEALVEMEKLTQALHETRLDFALLFQWFLERIRVHTNSTRSTEAANGATSHRNGAAAHGSKSLLNQRRLCDFLQRAGEGARRFQQQQPSHNKYRVETTFGNPVSRQLSSRPSASHSGGEARGRGCLGLLERIQSQWSVVMKAVSVTMASAISREESGCFGLGSPNNAVQESHIRFRQAFSAREAEDEDDEEESDEDEDDQEAVDWKALKHFSPARDDLNRRETVLMGFRLQSGALVLLRAGLDDLESPQLRQLPTTRLTWRAAVVGFSQGPSGNPVVLQGFDFYGDLPSGKDEQLALVLQRTRDDQARQGRQKHA